MHDSIRTFKLSITILYSLYISFDRVAILKYVYRGFGVYSLARNISCRVSSRKASTAGE
jgi:hypothetical protein